MSQHTLSSKVLKGTITIMLVGIVAKLIGFVSEAVLAAFLGTTIQSDAYYMVSSMKDIVLSMLGVGVWKVFLPLYKNYTTLDMGKAKLLADKVITFFSIITVLVSALIVLFAPLVVSIVAPGYKGEIREVCIMLVRISSPMYVFIVVAAIYASMLQCHNFFFGSQIREVVSHIPTIVAAALLYNRYGINAMALALVVSSILRLLIEIPFVNWGYKYKLDFRYNNPDFVLMLKRLPSALISASVVQLNTLVDKAMASGFAVGAVSELHYGQKLMNVFSGLLSSAIATAMYPQMIELIAMKKTDELRDLVVKIINIFCALMMPISIACILFRTEFVSVVFERGSFSSSNTSSTAVIFALYCLGLFFIACNTVISNIFYGYGDTGTAMHISIANLAVNVVLNIILIRILGVKGLAAATSLSAVLTFFVRMVVARKYIRVDGKQMINTGIRIIVASIAACLLPRALFNYFQISKLLTLMVSATMGVPIYILILRALKVTEINDLLLLCTKKVKKTIKE